MPEERDEPEFLRATRASYDAMAAGYAEYFGDMLASRPLDRALLAGFADLVRAAGAGPVLDVGCGPGQVTAHLHRLGVAISGVDLSPGMVAVARGAHPHLEFAVGSMTALEVPDAHLGGVVAWYSTIHVPDRVLPEVFAEFHRVLAPGGHALVAFQVGQEPLCLGEAFGQAVNLTFRRRDPDHVAGLLAGAGLRVRAQMVRQAHEGPGPEGERTPQAFLLAGKPTDG